MNENRRIDLLFMAILACYLLFLCWYTTQLSISHKEAQLFFFGKGFLAEVIRLSTQYFGQNDLGLRLPFILLGGANTLLIYLVSLDLLKKRFDALIAATLFMILPGMVASSLLVSEAGLLIFGTLLIVYLGAKNQTLFLLLLPLLAFLNGGFALLYLGLFFFAVSTRKTKLLFASLVLFGINMYLFGLPIGGKPKGHFVDILAIYAIVFSPFIFLYFSYAMYRILIKEEKPLVWYVACVALCFTIIFSLRQKIAIENFVPLSLIGFPLVIKVFLSGYRVRLPGHRGQYRALFMLSITILFVSTATLFGNKIFYRWLDNPKKHFAYHYHGAKELALAIKQGDAIKRNGLDDAMKLRLRFYGVMRT